MSDFKPYGDVLAVTGKYMKDGKEKNRYTKVGVLFTTPHMSRMAIKLDSVPVAGDGWLNVFKREDAVAAPAAPAEPEEVTEDIEKTLTLDNIPF